MAFMDFLFGKGEKTKTRPLYNPQQENILNMALGGLQSQLPQGLANLQNILGGNPETFEAFLLQLEEILSNKLYLLLLKDLQDSLEKELKNHQLSDNN